MDINAPTTNHDHRTSGADWGSPENVESVPERLDYHLHEILRLLRIQTPTTDAYAAYVGGDGTGGIKAELRVTSSFDRPKMGTTKS